LFNNRIYGLTKGQYSPTSELGKVTKSTPLGSPDRPVNPLASALGCGATFVARTVDRNIPHMEEMLKRAAHHKGAAFMEILQNCNVYNDLAWNVMYDKEQKLQYELRLEHGKPLLFGPPDDRHAVIMDGVKPKAVRAKDVAASALWIHDETNVNAAKLLADLFAPDFPVPIGVLAAVEGPVYEEIMLDQEQKVISERGPGDIAHRRRHGPTRRRDGRSEPDEPDPRDRPPEPLCDGPARADQPLAHASGRGARMVLRSRSLEPDGVVHRRERVDQRRRAALPQVRDHGQPRPRARAGHGRGRGRAARRQGRRPRRLRA